MKDKRKCKHCGKSFMLDRFNCHHQNYCKSIECRKASKKASQAKYLKRCLLNIPNFRNKESARVQEWQAKNPGYWKKRKKRLKKDSKVRVLRDFAQAGKLQEDIDILRDFAILQHTVLKGIISYTTGDVLRDNIGVQFNRLYDRGKEVSDTLSETDFINKIKNIKVYYEAKNTDRASSKTQNSGAF